MIVKSNEQFVFTSVTTHDSCLFSTYKYSCQEKICKNNHQVIVKCAIVW